MQKILLIHLDPAWRDRLSFILQHSGFQVVTSHGGHEALAEVSRSHPDGIVIAEGSHRLNRDELCPRIRELSQSPILILGQAEEEADGIGFLEMGADAYLTSPLNLRELLARVHSLLHRIQVNTTRLEEDS